MDKSDSLVSDHRRLLDDSEHTNIMPHQLFFQENIKNRKYKSDPN